MFGRCLSVIACSWLCSIRPQSEGLLFASYNCIMLEQCLTNVLAELNSPSHSPTWVGSLTDIAECVRALENYQPESYEDLEERVRSEVAIQIPELRNVFRYERGTQQKRDDWEALISLFEFPEFELPFQCPPNSPEFISDDTDLSVLTSRMQIRRLSSKFYSFVRRRKILYFTGDQEPGYVTASSTYRLLLEDYDTLSRRRTLERAIPIIDCLPNLTDYVFKRALGICFPKMVPASTDFVGTSSAFFVQCRGLWSTCINEASFN
ncbi:hypothetical protein OROMI_016500 [Orobanche minor]